MTSRARTAAATQAPRRPGCARATSLRKRASALLVDALALACLALPGAGGAFAQRSYVVERGDTLYAVARAHGTTVEALQSANALDGDLLRVGQVLRLPGSDGYRSVTAASGASLADVALNVRLSLATLRSANPLLPATGDLAGAEVTVPPAEGTTVVASAGDDLVALSMAAGVSPGELAAVNGLLGDPTLEPGQRVLLPTAPGAAAFPPTLPASAAGADAAEAVAGGGDAPLPGSGAPPRTLGSPTAATAFAAATSGSPRARLRSLQDAALAHAVELLATADLSAATFVAPVAGPITSRFGWRALMVDGNHFHGGVDLGVALGTPVLAARDGVVVKAGWGGAYGYTVFLDHGDGSETRYAHLSRILVKLHGSVRQGDPVGLSGSTGASTGPHVHFELRFDGRAVDPLDYLTIGPP